MERRPNLSDKNDESKRFGSSDQQEVVLRPQSMPDTVREGTQFLISMIRYANSRRPKGIAGIGYVVFLWLDYLPRKAIRLFCRVFLAWPLRRLRKTAIIKWITLRRIMLRFAVPLRTDNGNSPDRILASAVCQRNIHNVGVLLERGADPSGTLKTRSPFLLYAVRTRQHEIVRLLLEAGANVEAREPGSQTPAIWFAAQNNDIAMVQLLLKHRANTNASGLTGLTALMGAAAIGNAELVSLLIVAGADPSSRT